MVEYIAAGYWHTCALAYSGDLWCWGDNDYGQLGIGSTNGQNSPVAVSVGAGMRRNAHFYQRPASVCEC